MKPFVITDGKMIRPRVGRPQLDFDTPSKNDNVTDSDFIDNSASGDQLPLEFRSSENPLPHDTPHFQKLESDGPKDKIKLKSDVKFPSPIDEEEDGAFRYKDPLTIKDAMDKMLMQQSSSDWIKSKGNQYTSQTTPSYTEGAGTPEELPSDN